MEMEIKRKREKSWEDAWACPLRGYCCLPRNIYLARMCPQTVVWQRFGDFFLLSESFLQHFCNRLGLPLIFAFYPIVGEG